MGCCGLTVELIDEALTVELGPAIVGSGGGIYDYYDGAYDVEPLRHRCWRPRGSSCART